MQANAKSRIYERWRITHICIDGNIALERVAAKRVDPDRHGQQRQRYPNPQSRLQSRLPVFHLGLLASSMYTQPLLEYRHPKAVVLIRFNQRIPSGLSGVQILRYSCVVDSCVSGCTKRSNLLHVEFCARPQFTWENWTTDLPGELIVDYFRVFPLDCE